MFVTPAADRAGQVDRTRRRARRRGIGVELGRGHHDLRARVAGDVADGGRVDDLGPVERRVPSSLLGKPGSALPWPFQAYTCWSSDGTTISRAGPPARSPSVGEAMKPRLMWFSRVRSAGADLRRVDPDREPGDHAAVGVPGVHVLARRVHDLRLEVAVHVADRGRAQHLSRGRHLCVGGRARVHVRVGERPDRLAAVEARQRRAVGLQHAQLAARVGLHDVQRVVAVQVVHPLRRLAAGAGVPRPARVQGGVAVGEQHLAVLAAVARPSR